MKSKDYKLQADIIFFEVVTEIVLNRLIRETSGETTTTRSHYLEPDRLALYH
jgi:hypothetical protein